MDDKFLLFNFRLIQLILTTYGPIPAPKYHYGEEFLLQNLLLAIVGYLNS